MLLNSSFAVTMLAVLVLTLPSYSTWSPPVHWTPFLGGGHRQCKGKLIFCCSAQQRWGWRTWCFPGFGHCLVQGSESRWHWKPATNGHWNCNWAHHIWLTPHVWVESIAMQCIFICCQGILQHCHHGGNMARGPVWSVHGACFAWDASRLGWLWWAIANAQCHHHGWCLHLGWWVDWLLPGLNSFL